MGKLRQNLINHSFIGGENNECNKTIILGGEEHIIDDKINYYASLQVLDLEHFLKSARTLEEIAVKINSISTAHILRDSNLERIDVKFREFYNKFFESEMHYLRQIHTYPGDCAFGLYMLDLRPAHNIQSFTENIAQIAHYINSSRLPTSDRHRYLRKKIQQLNALVNITSEFKHPNYTADNIAQSKKNAKRFMKKEMKYYNNLRALELMTTEILEHIIRPD